MEKIHYSSLPKNAVISLRENSYYWENQLIFWHSHEAYWANQFLKKLVKKQLTGK